MIYSFCIWFFKVTLHYIFNVVHKSLFLSITSYLFIYLFIYIHTCVCGGVCMSILHEKQHDKIRWDFIDPGNLCVMVGTMKNALQCLSSQSIFLLFKTGHDLDVSKISPMYIFNERPYIQHICYIYCYIDSVTKLQDIEILIAVLVKYSLCKSKHKWQHHWPFFHHWPSCGSIFLEVLLNEVTLLLFVLETKLKWFH